MTLLRDDIAMTVAQFLAFTDARPDDERWELIDGEPILNPTPAWDHQRVVSNLIVLLAAQHQDTAEPWEVLPGLGVALSDTRLPVPDAMIRPARRISGHFCDDMLVALEVISPSSKRRDLQWKRDAYATLPSLRHYVVVAPNAFDVRCYDRATRWAERRWSSQDQEMSLTDVGVTLLLSGIYRGL